MNMEPTEVFPPSSLMPYVFATLGLSRSQQTMALHSAVMDGRGTDLFLSFSGLASSIPPAGTAVIIIKFISVIYLLA